MTATTSTLPRPGTGRRSRRRRTRVALALAVVLTVLLSGCSILEDLTAANDPAPTPTATPTKAPTPYPTQFTNDGTFQSHTRVRNLDFVYTVWPTKATPETNLWYPRGDKFFSFTFTVYDLNRKLRDRFATKRKVWLGNITVTSQTKTTSGTVEEPYYLDADAKRITFDPEPVSNRHGMLITSPKGAFELRNQKIGTLDTSTVGVDLTFRATVFIETRAGSDKYRRRVIRQKVPMSIFPSEAVTQVKKIPFTAN